MTKEPERPPASFVPTDARGIPNSTQHRATIARSSSHRELSTRPLSLETPTALDGRTQCLGLGWPGQRWPSCIGLLVREIFRAMKIYVAGPLADVESVRTVQSAIIAAGHELTLDWSRGPYASFTGDYGLLPEVSAKLAAEDLDAVLTADAVLIVASEHDGRGMFVELGAALARLVAATSRTSLSSATAGDHVRDERPLPLVDAEERHRRSTRPAQSGRPTWAPAHRQECIEAGSGSATSQTSRLRRLDQDRTRAR